jgi:hypothetical protein
LVSLKKLHNIPKPQKYSTCVELKLDLPKLGKQYIFRYYYTFFYGTTNHGFGIPLPLSLKNFEYTDENSWRSFVLENFCISRKMKF